MQTLIGEVDEEADKAIDSRERPSLQQLRDEDARFWAAWEAMHA